MKTKLFEKNLRLTDDLLFCAGKSFRVDTTLPLWLRFLHESALVPLALTLNPLLMVEEVSWGCGSWVQQSFHAVPMTQTMKIDDIATG